jgi:propionate CoA-transferase
MVTGNQIPAYNVPTGILFDMHREAAAKRPGVLTKVGMDTFVDPAREGCAMNAKAAEEAIVKRVSLRWRGLALLQGDRARCRDHPRDDGR